MKFSPLFLAAITLACSATAKPVKQCDVKGLHELAKKSGRYVGTATDKWILDQDAPYEQIAASKEFGQVTHENTVKWETIEPQPGVFDFTAADNLVNWAIENKKKIRGHTLVWHSQLAPWVEGNNYTASALKPILKNHVQTVAKHFKGKIFQWDVVNEVFNEDGTFRNSIFYKLFGEDYIEWAFRWAHEADPHARLYINDYNFEGVSPKTTAVTNLVRKLKKKGVPIHGIGAQAHLIVGSLPSSMEELWRTWSDDLKVDVAITELDIRMDLPEDEDKLAQQAADYAAVTKACMNVKRCVGITLWQYTDKYTWVPDVFAGQGSPCPWDETLEKKPAYYSMAAALKKHKK